VHKPKKEHIKGYTKCRALIHGKWVFIGRCIDYKNTLILKTQNKKQLRVITAYENKIDKYTKEYTTNTKGVKLWDIN
jgi:aromatic ring hydroxylase